MKLFVNAIMNEDALQIGLCDYALNHDVFLYSSTIAVSSLICFVMNLLIHIPVLSVHVIPKIKGCLFLQLMSHSTVIYCRLTLIQKQVTNIIAIFVV